MCQLGVDGRTDGGLHHRRNQGKDSSMSWGDLDLFRFADGITLALKNFCSGGKSHHRDFDQGDATLD